MRNSLFLLLLLAVQAAFPQTPYCYERDTMVIVGGQSYNVVDKVYQFEIINTKYTLYDQEMVDFQGNAILSGEYYGAGVEVDTFWRAFTETFTEEDIAVMRDAETPTIIYVFITKDYTGKAIEVVLTIWKSSGAMVIPPEKWAQYEQNIKQYVRWHGVTEDERNTPFSHHFYQIDKRDLQKRFPRYEFRGDAKPIN